MQDWIRGENRKGKIHRAVVQLAVWIHGNYCDGTVLSHRAETSLDGPLLLTILLGATGQTIGNTQPIFIIKMQIINGCRGSHMNQHILIGHNTINSRLPIHIGEIGADARLSGQAGAGGKLEFADAEIVVTAHFASTVAESNRAGRKPVVFNLGNLDAIYIGSDGAARGHHFQIIVFSGAIFIAKLDGTDVAIGAICVKVVHLEDISIFFIDLPEVVLSVFPDAETQAKGVFIRFGTGFYDIIGPIIAAGIVCILAFIDGQNPFLGG